MEARSKMIEKFDEAVSKNKEQIIAVKIIVNIPGIGWFHEFGINFQTV